MEIPVQTVESTLMAFMIVIVDCIKYGWQEGKICWYIDAVLVQNQPVDHRPWITKSPTSI
jgi:hypothetical protein